ncbi:Asparagine synthase [alpha proteobacterium HIMB59]|nr:Asparagine synthase [alpha proteobacterium HIMB59]
MCGFLITCDNNIQIDKFNKSFEQIRSRGPDESRITQHKNILKMGFHRLSIIDDHERSMQPFFYKNKILLYNGEFYNYVHIKKKIQNNHKIEFHTNSDTEVFLQNILINGIEGYEDIIGMFAFAIFDKEKNEIKFGRDNFGIKPLYYYFDHKSLIISSSIKSVNIIAQQKINNFNLINFNKYGFTYGDETIYQNINECKPGIEYTIDLNMKTLRSKSFFNLKNIISNQKNNFINNKVDYFKENIKLHLVSDVKSCVLKSNGIDSNLIAYYKNEIQKKNEYIYFDKNNINFKIQHSQQNFNSISLSEDEYQNYFHEYLDSLEYPTIDGFNTYLITKISNQNKYKVCLSGLGLDEIFDGYGISKKIRLAKILNSLKFFKKFTYKPNNIKIDKLISCANCSDILDYYLEIRKISTQKNLFKKFETKEIENHRLKLKTLMLESLSITNISTYKKNDLIKLFEFEFYLKNQLLKDSDFFSMLNSVELRVPFVEKMFIENISVDNPNNINKRKYLFLNYKSILNNLNIEKQKEGFIAHNFYKLKGIKNYENIINIVNKKFI